jgi:hypothetical protein
MVTLSRGAVAVGLLLALVAPAAAGTSPFAMRLPRQERFQILTNRVWVDAGNGSAPIGATRIFLPTGTLVEASCGGIQRLSPWQMSYDGSLTWNEAGTDIKADIIAITTHELVLSVKRGAGDTEEHYTPASVPSVLCPDLSKR